MIVLLEIRLNRTGLDPIQVHRTDTCHADITHSPTRRNWQQLTIQVSPASK
jgi:hypothetical protein